MLLDDVEPPRIARRRDRKDRPLEAVADQSHRDRVRARPLVAAAESEDQVVARAARQVVAPLATGDPVVARRSRNPVGTGTSAHHVIPGRPV